LTGLIKNIPELGIAGVLAAGKAAWLSMPEKGIDSSEIIYRYSQAGPSRAGSLPGANIRPTRTQSKVTHAWV
jgi:hypothetical protein